jgi:hypothetical protein
VYSDRSANMRILKMQAKKKKFNGLFLFSLGSIMWINANKCSLKHCSKTLNRFCTMMIQINIKQYVNLQPFQPSG